jgi:hypothetical protein
MKYETPDLKALTPAITAIQNKKDGIGRDGELQEPPPVAYEDWEE